jgi:hypothetical protein
LFHEILLGNTSTINDVYAAAAHLPADLTLERKDFTGKKHDCPRPYWSVKAKSKAGAGHPQGASLHVGMTPPLQMKFDRPLDVNCFSTFDLGRVPINI